MNLGVAQAGFFVLVAVLVLVLDCAPACVQAAIASVLKLLVDSGTFNNGQPQGDRVDYEMQLYVAYVSFKEWKRVHHIACSQPCFTTANTGCGKPTGYPWFAAKAYNTRCVLGWIAEVASTRSRQDASLRSLF